MDTLATIVISLFENIDQAWEQQVHLSWLASDHIDTLLSKVQWTQTSLAKELATQQTFWEFQNNFWLKIQNELGKLDTLLKQLLVMETTTYSSDDVPPPLEDDDPIGTEAHPVEDKEDQEQLLKYKEYHPHLGIPTIWTQNLTPGGISLLQMQEPDVPTKATTTTFRVLVALHIDFLNSFMDHLTFNHIWATLDLKTAYWGLHMAEKQPPIISIFTR